MGLCKEICKRYKPKKISKNSSRYIAGQKYCKCCNFFVTWDGVKCPCCGFTLRTHPKSKNHTRENYRYL